MKALLTLFISILAIMPIDGVEAQDASLGYEQTYWTYTGLAADTIGAGSLTWEFDIKKLTDQEVKPYVYLTLDSLGGSSEVSVYLQSKVFSDQSYSDLDTLTWSVTSADTTLIFDYSTATRSDYWNVKVVGSNADTQVGIGKLNWKFYKQ